MRRWLAVLTVAVLVASVAAVYAQPAGLHAGASAQNMTPFTVIPGQTTADPLSNVTASNPDGLPGGLWDSFTPEPGFSSSGQITPSGIWGEQFTDENGNARYDAGEPFVDDPVNTRLDVTSAGKWDGIYMAGFGNDRIPRGVFDPIWARALYVRDPASGFAYAQASIDVIGWFGDWTDRIVRLARDMDPNLDLDHLIVGSTHDHESVDTHLGLWGVDTFSDGTYPKFERYIEVKIAQAVVEAASKAGPARFRFASIRPGTPFTTLRGTTEDLEGLQSRNSCRTPWVFDDEVRVVHVTGDPARGADDSTIGTIVNWGTHPESMEDGNQYLSSDFVHAIRETVEEALGGVALFIPGALGAAEVVGDSCLRRWQRTTFDGEIYPVAENGEPIVLQNVDTDPIGPRNRTYALGRVVGSAAAAAANAAAFDGTATAIEGFTAQDLFVPINNTGLSALSAAGVIDKPAYIGGVSITKETFGAAGMYTSPPTGVDGKTTVYAWKIGTASFLTAPGELAPEIYLGLVAHNRAAAASGDDHFDHVSPNPAAVACAAAPFSYDEPRGAATGRPFEPGIRAAQVSRFGTTHNFLFGMTPDELGYMVPGYDFAWYAAPAAHGVGLGALVGEAPDPCAEIPPDLAFPEVRYRDHYQETNSAGSMLAPAYACTVWEMLGLDPATSDEGGAACVEWEEWRNAGVVHFDIDPAISRCDPTGEDVIGDETGCVRHY
jgi:hypothetical protein